jgi:hypothetical protein
VLEALAWEQPGSTPVHLELGIARGQAGNAAAAVSGSFSSFCPMPSSSMRAAIRSAPASPDSSSISRGQNFSYDLEDIGRSYRDYVELMAQIGAGVGRVESKAVPLDGT